MPDPPNRAARRAAEKYRRRMDVRVNAANFTPEQKLAFVEDQVRRKMAAQREFLLCPYCGGENWPHGEICCELMTKAIAAVLDRMDKADEQREIVEFMGEVADRTAAGMKQQSRG